jgi:hypothetical protein
VCTGYTSGNSIRRSHAICISPEVISSKDLLRKKSLLPDFKMYDAVPAADKTPSAPPVDPEIAKFLPMLDDYLKCRCPTVSTGSPLN